MTPRARELLGTEIAEEQVAWWESEGLGYAVMLRLVGHPRPNARFASRGLAVAIIKLVWLRMGAA